jgi:hypothetical protein
VAARESVFRSSGRHSRIPSGIDNGFVRGERICIRGWNGDYRQYDRDDTAVIERGSRWRSFQTARNARMLTTHA